MNLQEAIQRFDVSKIIEQFGTWAVTKYGVECLTAYYPIEKSRLNEQDWVYHMAGKSWVNMQDFKAALEYAQHAYKPKKPGRNQRNVSTSTRFDVMKRDGYRCQLCGKQAKDGVKLHVDHIKPLAKGGSNAIKNLQTLCAACNLGKGTKSL